MNEHHETINQLIERSSLGTPDARAARASVPRTVARRLVVASTTNTSTLRRAVVTGRWVRTPTNTSRKFTEGEG